MHISATRNPFRSVLNYVLGLLALSATWYVVYFYIAASVEGLLVPWDVLKDGYPLGTPQRAINDFFEGPPGNLLLSQVTIVVGILSLFRRWFRNRTPQVVWRFVAANLVFLTASLFLTWLGGVLDIGWYRLTSQPLAEARFNLWSIAGFFLAWLGLLYLYVAGLSPVRRLSPSG